MNRPQIAIELDKKKVLCSTIVIKTGITNENKYCRFIEGT